MKTSKEIAAWSILIGFPPLVGFVDAMIARFVFSRPAWYCVNIGVMLCVNAMLLELLLFAFIRNAIRKGNDSEKRN